MVNWWLFRRKMVDCNGLWKSNCFVSQRVPVLLLLMNKSAKLLLFSSNFGCLMNNLKEFEQQNQWSDIHLCILDVLETQSPVNLLPKMAQLTYRSQVSTYIPVEVGFSMVSASLAAYSGLYLEDSWGIFIVTFFKLYQSTWNQFNIRWFMLAKISTQQC